jgi:hypothetical protein
MTKEKATIARARNFVDLIKRLLKKGMGIVAVGPWRSKGVTPACSGPKGPCKNPSTFQEEITWVF